MDKKTWIGFLLIAVVVVAFTFINRPSKEEVAKMKQERDSIANVEYKRRKSEAAYGVDAEREAQMKDMSSLASGSFAHALMGNDSVVVLENNKVRLEISSRGAYVSKAELKNYKAYGDTVNPLCLFKDLDHELDFVFMTKEPTRLHTKYLYFEPIKMCADSLQQSLVMRLKTMNEDSYLDFVYTLPADDYMLDLSIQPHNMHTALMQNVSVVEMYWKQRIPQQEKGRKFEEKYAQLQYMFPNGDMEKLDEAKDDKAKEITPVKWVAHKDQFFSTVMIAKDAFELIDVTSKLMGAHTSYIKEYTTKAELAFDVKEDKPIDLTYYFGPNHYNTLKAYDKGKDRAEKLRLNELVPLGWKLVAWINKILVIPMFDLFTSWGLHIGVVIFLMTLVIKLILLPFVFVSNRSSAKMRVLKPQLDEINAKYPPEKMQERQQATMALYQKAGVSPLSGCLPMLFQFPILMAMFWFLPTAIELRGQSLFWADDLSTYDAIITWERSIPLFGNHLSLFCLIMTVVNIIYTHLTMQTQSTGQEMKMMKWMMYLMPLMFLFFFNDYAAGLSYYYFISLLFTILQTMIFRWTTNEKKLLAQMEANAKKNTGKKSGFMARLEAMQREQQRLAREQAKAQQKKMR